MSRGRSTGGLGLLVFAAVMALVLVALAFVPLGMQKIGQLWREWCRRK